MSSIRQKIKDSISKTMEGVFYEYRPDPVVTNHFKEVLKDRLPELIDPAEVVKFAKEQLSGGKLKELVGNFFSRHGQRGEGWNLAFERVKEMIPDVQELIDPAEVLKFAKEQLSEHNLRSIVRSTIQEQEERVQAYIASLLPEDIGTLIDEEVARENVRQAIEDQFATFRLRGFIDRNPEISQKIRDHATQICSEVLLDLLELIPQAFTEKIKQEMEEELRQKIESRLNSFVYSGQIYQMINDQVYKHISPELKRLVTPELVRKSIKRRLPDATDRVVNNLFGRSGRPGFDQLLERLYPIIGEIVSEVVDEIQQGEES